MPSGNAVFVDTSGWLSYVNAKDPLHDDVTRLLSQLNNGSGRFVTTNYVIAELVALLTSRLRIGRPRLIEIIDLIKASANVQILHISPELDNEAWALLKARQDKEWSLVDAASFVVMRQLGMTEAVTTDHHFHHFDQAGFIRLPSE